MINVEKSCVIPAQQINFLAFVLDSVSMTIDLFGLIRHTLVTWSEMGKQTRSSIGRQIECHVSVPQIARMVHYCKVFDCNNNSTDERLSFHKFPDDPKLQKVSLTCFDKLFKS